MYSDRPCRFNTFSQFTPQEINLSTLRVVVIALLCEEIFCCDYRSLSSVWSEKVKTPEFVSRFRDNIRSHTTYLSEYF